MSGFNRITKERYLEIKEEARKLALENPEREDKAILVEERRKDFSSEDERIVFIGNLYFRDDDEFLKDYNMYNRNIKLMADNYDIDTYIVRCKVLEMAMFKETKSISNEIIQMPIVKETEEDVQVEKEDVSSDFDEVTDSFLEESLSKIDEISERNIEIETLQKSLIESVRVAKVSVSRKNEELDCERKQLDKEREEFESYRREEMENLSNERVRLDEEEERLLALKDKIMDTIKSFEEAKANLASMFNDNNDD